MNAVAVHCEYHCEPHGLGAGGASYIEHATVGEQGVEAIAVDLASRLVGIRRARLPFVLVPFDRVLSIEVAASELPTVLAKALT